MKKNSNITQKIIFFPYQVIFKSILSIPYYIIKTKNIPEGLNLSYLFLKGVVDGINFKIFGSWSGGYLDGDSWRLSSGLKSIEYKDDGSLFMHNHSGSIYKGHINNEGISSAYSNMVLNNMVDKYNESKEECAPEFRIYQLSEYENSKHKEGEKWKQLKEKFI